MNRKKIFSILSLSLLAIPSLRVEAAPAGDELARRVSGRILLQVESHGEAWYINPANNKKYHLGRPADALLIMQWLSAGASDADLKKIPVGLISYPGDDTDGDGLTGRIEEALGSDPSKTDTDGDGYSDREEIANSYNPNGPGRLPLDANFTAKHSGKIFLQAEGRGEAWYVNPADRKRYYLGRPADALAVMGRLGLGVTDADLGKIMTGYSGKVFTFDIDSPSSCRNCGQASDVIAAAATAIRAGDAGKAAVYFTADMRQAVAYTMDALDAEGRLALANTMSGAVLTSSSADEKTYTAEVYFDGEKIPVNFKIKKQPDGSWLLANL